jgi:hypothetical protein
MSLCVELTIPEGSFYVKPSECHFKFSFYDQGIGAYQYGSQLCYDRDIVPLLEELVIPVAYDENDEPVRDPAILAKLVDAAYKKPIDWKPSEDL